MLALAIGCGDAGDGGDGDETAMDATGVTTSGTAGDTDAGGGTDMGEATGMGDDDGGDGDATSGGDGDATSGGDGDATSGGDGDGDPIGTPGCGQSWDGPGLTDGAVSVGGAVRSYLRVIPDGYDPDVPTPVVFAWHGQGGSGSLARLYYGVEEASNDGAIFIYPDGLPQQSVGGDTGWDLSPTGDVNLFDALLAQISTDACVDRDRIFSTGHSFGGYISNALACYRGAEILAIGEVAGGPSFWPCAGDSQVAAWLAHDPADVVVPFDQGTDARDQHLGRNNCGATTVDVTPAPCVAYDGCDEGLPVVWCSHDQGGNGGHSWPGFAGAAIWDFFAAQ